MGQKVGPQAEAKDGNVRLIHDLPQLVDLRRGQKLGFVGDDDVFVPGDLIAGEKIILRGDDIGLPEQTYLLRWLRHRSLYGPDT